MDTLTPEQIASFPAINEPLKSLSGLRIISMPAGFTDVRRVILTPSITLFLGMDNRLYVPRLGNRWISYESSPDSRYFGDGVLRALRQAKLLTTAAITEHRKFVRESDAAWKHGRMVRAFENAAKDLGIKPTRQQLRDIAKRAPKTATA